MDKLDLSGFISDKAKVKYACANQAIATSKNCPEELYSDFNFFTRLLQSDNNIFKWTAIKVIGNLSKVDNEKKVDKILPSLITLLSDRNMITAANTIGALTEIIINKPQYTEVIINALLKVEKAKYYNKGEISPECRNVAIGHVIKSFKRLGERVYYRKDVQAFLKRQTVNTRPKVREMSKKLLIKTISVFFFLFILVSCNAGPGSGSSISALSEASESGNGENTSNDADISGYKHL